mgnify:CR=1 FL=1
MLLTAVATAMQASSTNHRENVEIADGTQAARVLVQRLAREVRTAEAVDLFAPSEVLRIVPPADGSGVTYIEYEYDIDNERLLYKVTKSEGTDTYVLLGGDDGLGVRMFYVSYEFGQDWQGVDCAKSVTIRLELETGGEVISLTTSACPRRNQVY